MKHMKILISDRLQKDQLNSDWKEGWEFFYAFNKLGINCDIAGPNCPISETRIPDIAYEYDFILVTENYADRKLWQWWDWRTITTPKMFWAIDTHLIDYRPWLLESNFTYLGMNNKCDLDKYSDFQRFYFPYGVSSKHYGIDTKVDKSDDITFLGMLTQDRLKYIQKYHIKHIQAYGYKYVQALQQSKICFNKSISYDLNAKMLEILAAGTFMLSNYNESFWNLTKENSQIATMLWHTDDELHDKIHYYLEHSDERETIVKNVRDYILKNHSYENRAKLLLERIITR